MSSHPMSGTLPMSFSARGWVDRISNIFRKEVAIQLDHLPPVCVFEVPKALSTQKPEAYTPQLIALGPYHHLRPELYQMERHKLAAIKQISTPEQMFNFQQLVIRRLKEIDPCTRACYNKFMDYDQDTLAWIIAIDGCFLLNLVHSYLESRDATNKRLLDNTIITRDIMMVENQIPYVLLQEIRRCLQFCSDNDEQDHEMLAMLLDFCEAQSPLKLNVDRENYHRAPYHLLDLMYHLIVDLPGRVPTPREDGPPGEVSIYVDISRSSSSASSNDPEASSNDPEVIQENVGAILEMVESVGNKRAQAILKPFKIVSDIPWSSISGLFRKGTLQHGEENNSVDEIAIPSVSHLWRYADVKCRPIAGGINDIKFVEAKATLYLPVLNLNSSSEVMLRNLVAYEAATSKSTLEFARYVNLMNGIIDTAEDVKLLKQNGVVFATLTDDEIADLFNGMKRFYVRTNQKSNIEIAIEKVNEYYDKKLMVRLIRRIKKNLYASWKCLALISTVLLLVVLAIQSFCSIYSCSRFWGGLGNLNG